MRVPCGTCILCREAQAQAATIRIMHEATLHAYNCLITLTYDDEHIPEDGGLHYEDLQKFWKRLRKAGKKIRYYAVGEYGDKTKRPHYHAVVFGEAWLEGRIITSENPRHWTSHELVAAWGKGQVDVTTLNMATAAYAASYVTKKLREKQRYVRIDEETGELIALQQPRSFMSKYLAKKWWTLFNQGIRDHDYVVIEGRKMRPPRQYDDWLGEVDEKKLEEVKNKRKEKVEYDSKTESKNRARARSAHARAKSKTKKL